MIDPLSSEGRQLLQWLDEQLETKRKALERPIHDIAQTQYIRGQVKAYRTMGALLRGEPDDHE